MTNTVVKSVNLFFCGDNSDKEYRAFLEDTGDGYLVNALYGRRGNCISPATKTPNGPVSFEKAEELYDKLVQEKMKKGYKPDGSSPVSFSSMPSRESTGLIPMLLNPIEDAEIYLNDDSWIAQEKFDGRRILVSINDGVVQASNREGLVCGIPGEIEQELSGLSNVILDGELIGSQYIVFDCLEYRGTDLRNMTCEYRYNALTSLSGDFNYVRIAPTAFTAEEKSALFNSLIKDKEGIVFKQKFSKYTSGRPASGGSALKLKFWESATCVVLGINDKRSISVGVADGDQIVCVGNCSVPVNYNLPEVGQLCEVKYLYYFENGALYQPQYKGIRDDKTSPDSLSTLKRKLI